MKRHRWIWLIVIALLIAGGAGVWLLRMPALAAISFVEFRDRRGEKVAVFEIENRARSSWGSVEWEAEPVYQVQTSSGWVDQPAAPRLRIDEKTTCTALRFGPDAPLTMEYEAPLPRAGNPPVAGTPPFRAGIRVNRGAPAALNNVAGFFGFRIRPQSVVIWSEVVTP